MLLLEVTVENIRLKGVKKESRSMDACPGTESNPAPLSHEENHKKKKNLAVKQQKHTKVSYKKQSQEREQGDHFTKH